MEERFHPPVSIARDSRGCVSEVTSTREIAEYLMDPLWPLRGPAYRRACAVALARYENPGGTTNRDVRDAFEQAADEAGILAGTCSRAPAALTGIGVARVARGERGALRTAKR